MARFTNSKIKILTTVTSTILASICAISFIRTNSIPQDKIINKFNNSRISTQQPLIKTIGSLEELFNVNYLAPASSNEPINVGIQHKNLWNISFNGTTPILSNLSNQFISDVPTFSTKSFIKPTTNDKNAINLTFYNKDGSVNSELTNSFENKLVNKYSNDLFTSLYGFNNVEDPMLLSNLTLNTPLVKLSYQYSWNDDQYAKNLKASPFSIIQGENTWAFNGYLGLDKNQNVVYFDDSDQDGPTLTVNVPQTFSPQMTANEFVENIDQYKNLITINIMKYLPIDQIFDINIVAVPEQGKVQLQYKTKNTISKNDNWWSDINTDNSDVKTIDLITNLWVNTEVENETIDGSIFTKGYIPSTVTDDIFKQWIFNNRLTIFKNLPNDITLSDINITDCEILGNSISYNVSLNKFYSSGVKVTDSWNKPTRITITNFETGATIVEQNQNYQSSSIIIDDIDKRWDQITVNELSRYIESIASDETQKNNLASLLIKISGNIPYGLTISSISVNSNADTSPSEGKISLKFVLSKAYISDESNTIIEEQNVEYDFNYEGLKKVNQTSIITGDIEVSGYENYIISTISSSNIPVELTNKIKKGIIDAYNSYNFGDIPNDLIVTGFELDFNNSSNVNGYIKLKSYTLNKYIDENGNVQEVEKTFEYTDQAQSCNITGFAKVQSFQFEDTQNVDIVANDTAPDVKIIDINFLKSKGVLFSNLFNINNESLTYNLFATQDEPNEIVYSLDNVTINTNNAVVNYEDGSINGIQVTINNAIGDTSISEEITNTINIRGFKTTSSVKLIKETLNLSEIGENNDLFIYTKTIPQLAYSSGSFLVSVHDYINSNKDNFFSNLPDILSDDYLNITIESYNNSTGTLIISIELKDVVIDGSLASNYSKIGSIEIQNFIALENATSDSMLMVDISNDNNLNSIFAREFNVDQASNYINTDNFRETYNFVNINVSNHSDISCVSNFTDISIGDSVIIEQNYGIKVTFKTNSYYKISESNDIIIEYEEKIFEAFFYGFKTPVNATLNHEFTFENEDLISNNYAQIFNPNLYDDKIQGQNKLIEIQNLINNNKDLFLNKMVDNPNNLISKADLIINSVTSSNNQDGTLIISAYLSHIYDDFGNEVENNSDNSTTITLHGFKKAVPTFKGSTITPSLNDVFHVNYLYQLNNLGEQEIKNSLLNYIINNKDFFFNDPNQNILIDNIQYNILQEENKVDVVLSFSEGIDNDYNYHNNFFSIPYKNPITYEFSINADTLNDTCVSEEYLSEITFDGAVSDYYTPGGTINIDNIKTQFNNQIILNNLFINKPNEDLDINDFEIKINDESMMNAATGTLSIKLIQINGSYFSNNQLVDASTNHKEYYLLIKTKIRNPITSFMEKMVVNYSQLIGEPSSIENKYAYEIINNINNEMVVNYLNNNKSEWIKNDNIYTNPNTTEPYTSDLIIDETNVSLSNIIADNKNQVISLEVNGIKIPRSKTYNSNGFLNTQEFTINLELTINLKTEIGTLSPGSYTKISSNTSSIELSQYKDTKVSDAVASNGGSVKEFTYKTLFEYLNNQLKNKISPIFEGLNVNVISEIAADYNKFKQWISVETSSARINDNGSISNIKLVFNNNYFKNDSTWTWVGNDSTIKSETFTIAFDGFKENPGVNWVVIVAISSGVVGILIILLTVIFLIRRKQKLTK